MTRARHRVEENRPRLAGKMRGDWGLVLPTPLADPFDPATSARLQIPSRKAGVLAIPGEATGRTCANLVATVDVHARVTLAVPNNRRRSFISHLLGRRCIDSDGQGRR